MNSIISIFKQARIISFDHRIQKKASKYNHPCIEIIYIDPNSIKTNRKINLKEYEKKYGIPNLGLISMHDYKNTIKLKIEDYFIFWEDYFKKFKPDLFFVSFPANVSSIIFFLLARNYGKSVLSIMNVGTIKRVIITDGNDDICSLFYKWPGLEDEYDNIKNKGLKDKEINFYEELITKIVEKKEVPYYVRQKKPFKQRILDNILNPKLGKPFSSFLYRYRYYSNIQGREFFSNSPYFFFPLHFEPETALDLFAPFFRNQLTLIEYIHQSLPFGYKLVIKEHPNMFGQRKINFINL